MFYDVFDWRDFRVMVPIFFAVVAYLIIIYPKYRITAIAGVTLCLAFLIYGGTYIANIRSHYGELEKSGYANYIYYDQNADSRFDNTLVSMGMGMPLDTPPGIGFLSSNHGDSKIAADKGIRWLIAAEGANISNLQSTTYYVVAQNGWTLYRLGEKNE
jgi:hypothetical protein